MIMSGWSVHLSTLFPGLTSTSCTSGREENVHRNYFMLNLQESMGPAGIKLATPGLQSATHLESDMLPTGLRDPILLSPDFLNGLLSPIMICTNPSYLTINYMLLKPLIRLKSYLALFCVHMLI